MSRRSAKPCNIQVAVRCRPRNKQEIDSNSAAAVKCDDVLNQIECKVKQGQKLDSKSYSFDNVFGPNTSQLEVYQRVVEPILEEVLQGYNCTVFAYGQTGTGKTHTMEGYRTGEVYESYVDDPSAGIIPRALHQLFEKLEAGESEFSVRVSFLEIYNEELFDLLSGMDDNKKLRLFEDSRSKGSVVIQGLEEVIVHDKDEVYEIMRKGADKRRTGETKMNKSSSRSHSVFSVTVHQKENSVSGEELLKTGKLYMVDLAGSENIGRSGAVKGRAREAGNINQSLLTLGRVISKLVAREAHIPYRESKLTRLLQDSLGGKTKTSIIATVSPAMLNLEETLSTLEYAFRAKNIQNRPEVNQKLTKRALIKEYTEEIERLKKDLAATREKNGVFVSPENYEKMQAAMAGQASTIDEMEDKITKYQQEVEKVRTMFEKTAEQLQETEAELGETKTELVETKDVLDHTKVELEQTVEEKETQEYLVDHHRGVEQKLYREATTLLEVTDTTTDHVDKLHGKIERKTAVEQHNEQTSTEFQEAFRQRLDAFKGDIATFAETQAAKLQGLSSFVSKTAGDCGAIAEALTSKMGANQTQARARLDELQSLSKAQQEARRTWSIETGDHRTGLVNSMLTTITASQEEHVAASAALAAQIMGMMGFVAEALDQIQAGITDNHAQFTMHSQGQMASLASLGESIESFATKQVSGIEEHKAAMQGILQAQQQQQAAQIGSYKAQMDTLFQQMLAAQESALQMALTSTSDQAATLSGAVTGFQAEASAGIAAIREAGSAHASNAEGNVAQTGALVQAKKATAEENASATLAALQTIDQTIMVRAETQRSTMQSHNLEHLAGLEQMVAAGESDMEALTATVETLVEETEAGRAEEATTLNELNGATQGLASELQTRARDMMAATTSMNAECEARIAERTEDMHDFFSAKLRRDVPTGHTPRRQPYQFPKALTKSEPVDQLILQFKQRKMAGSSEDSGLGMTEAAVAAEEAEMGDSNATTEEADGGESPAEATELDASVAESEGEDDEISFKGAQKENMSAIPKPKSMLPKREGVTRSSPLSSVN